MTTPRILSPPLPLFPPPPPPPRLPLPPSHAPGAAPPAPPRIAPALAASASAADYLDVETGAATDAAVATWYAHPLRHYRAAARPGPRWPGFYTSASNVTPLVNALIAGSIHSGPRLIIANWNLNQPEAAAALTAALTLLASGGPAPFPIPGFQFADPGPHAIAGYT